jgi:enamine deaminase RidA (YjgF/YER057c/UK114 family)
MVFDRLMGQLVMNIGNTMKKLVFDEVVVASLSKEVKQKAYESNNEAFVVHERPK